MSEKGLAHTYWTDERHPYTRSLDIMVTATCNNKEKETGKLTGVKLSPQLKVSSIFSPWIGWLLETGMAA